MSKLAAEMLRDLDKETVDYYPTFDDTGMQPVVLPARFPNLLVNGSDGIAVGMATNIPPHNLSEVISGVIAQIDNPDITVDELMTHIPAPPISDGRDPHGQGGHQARLLHGARQLYPARALRDRGVPVRQYDAHAHHRERDPVPGPTRRASSRI